MPEPSTDAESGVLALLDECEPKSHCRLLAAHVYGYLPPDALSYEDVFYPLRHHTGELAHRVDLEALTYWIRWGSGDYLYAMSLQEDSHAGGPAYSDEFAVERPVSLYHLAVGEGFTPVLIEDSPFGGHPDEYFAESPEEWDRKNAGGGDGA